MIRSFTRLLGVAIAISAIFPAFASATTRYVGVYGSASSPACVQSDPCELVHGINDVATAGDEVIVESGTYELGDSTVQLSDGHGAINVHGDRGATPPTLTGTRWDLFFSRPGSRVSRLRLISTDINDTPLNLGHGAVGEQLFAQSAATTVGNGACFVRDGALLRDSVCVLNATASPGAAVESYGCYGCLGTGPPSVVTIRNVTAVVTGPGGHAIQTLADNTPAGDDSTLHVVNSIAFGGDVNAEADPGATRSLITLSHSNVATTSHTGTAAAITGDGTNQNGVTNPPRFVNPLFGDFRETASSPTIDHGANSTANGAFDFEGNPRISGARTDIGADEFEVAVKCVVPRLMGKTLKKAKALLARAHCALGHVKRPRHSKGRRLFVVGQSPAGGQVRAAGTRVSLKLSRHK